MMLGRAIYIGLLLAACQGCTVVSCPASLSCALKTNTAAQGGGSSAGEDGGAGGSPEDASDAGSVFPPGQWVSVIGNLKGKPSFCGNLSGVWQWPGQDVLVAGVAGQGLFIDAADGMDWVQLGSGKGSEPINHAPETVLFDPANSDHFWECGIHGTGDGAYATTDGGKTFTRINVVPQADTIAVDFSNAQRKVLFTTGHENNQSVQRSTDGANTWSNISATLPDDRACTIFMLVDSTTYLVGCGVSGGLTGIYRTADSAKHWVKVSNGGGAQRPILAKDGSIYWTTAGTGQLLRSTDQGQTWLEMFPPNQLQGASPIELPDGRLVAFGPQSLVISSNHGQLWDYLSPRFPHVDEMGVTYSTTRKAFYIWRWDCHDEVLPDAIMRFDFDYETQ
jgi:photosystem II stability/assembly factor-like uncharacterized protein